MPTYTKELTPVQYLTTGIKVVNFKVLAGHGCFRTHWHDRVEIIRVHKGEMYIGYGSNIRKISSGEMTIITPKSPHKGFTIEQDVDYDVLMFDVRSFYNDTEICKTYLPAIYEGRAIFRDVIEHYDTIHCFDKIIQNADGNFLDTTAFVYQLLFLLFQYSLVEFKNEISHDNNILHMIEYMETHFDEALSTESLCEHFGYTSAHFCRKFKGATGLTPMNYLRIYRMEQAYRMLKAGETNISEVAERCGFVDANYFTRCFKNHFGMAPSSVRAAQKVK